MLAVAAIAIEAFACAAITKKGTRCKRPASPGSEYCWQHGGTTKAQRAAGLTAEDVAKMRCKARTKSGTQCKRTAQKGTDFCWQHQNSQAETDKGSEDVSNSKAESKDSIPAERVQCDAITKSGSRCSRKALSGGTKCWQHAK